MKKLTPYVVVFVALAVITLPTFLKTASAYHLYTHVWTTQSLYADLNDGDSSVNINGREYPVAQPIVISILGHPDFYNAGVIGPDLFPDMVYGQSIIHPSRTGAFLLTLYSEAWHIFLDQNSLYSERAKQEILAFTYGYLTHAAGDIWAHTLINDFSGGIFPSWGKILTDPTGNSALIALRHTVVEAYINEATPWFDSPDIHDLDEVAVVCDAQNPEFYHDATLDSIIGASSDYYYKCKTTVPGAVVEGTIVAEAIVQDKSNVGTPGIVLPTGDEWDSPAGIPPIGGGPGVSQFLFDTLLSPNANTPDLLDPGTGNLRASCPSYLPSGTLGPAGCPNGPYKNLDFSPRNDRGLVINLFLDLEAALQIAQAGAQERTTFQKCFVDFHGCERSIVTIDVPTVRGHYSLQVTRYHDQCLDDSYEASCVADQDRVNRPAGCLFTKVDPLYCYDPTTLPEDLFSVVKLEYLKDWIPGIDNGLKHWSDFWLGFAKGFADPQTYRDAQNDECKDKGRGTGMETDDRLSCEMKVSKLTSIIYALDHLYPNAADGEPSFMDKYLCPMFGAIMKIHCAVSDTLETIKDELNDFFSWLNIPNPLAPIIEWLHDIKEKIINFVFESFIGVDLDTLEEFTQSVTKWICGLSDYASAPTLTIQPGVGLTAGVDVFNLIKVIYGALVQLTPTPFQLTISPPQLFSPSNHTRLDNLMGLPPDHHSDSEAMLENASQDCFTLNDSAKFDPEKFAAFRNTQVMSKLLVLDGNTLNRLIADNLSSDGVVTSQGAKLVHTYENDTLVYDPSIGESPTTPSDDYVIRDTDFGFLKSYSHQGPTNIMLDSLSQRICDEVFAACFYEAGDPWLDLIDGDHAWRQDGLPRFCTPDPPPVQPTPGHPAPESCSSNPNATPRLVKPSDPGYDMPNAGTGQFPMWESCLARPVLRDLFKDWENGASNFPDLGDAPSTDPSVVSGRLSVVSGPSINLAITGPEYTQTNDLGLTTRFVDENNQFTLSATDDVFTAQNLKVQYRVYKTDTVSTPPFQILDSGGTISIPHGSTSGFYSVDYYASSPCADGSSNVQTDEFFLLNGPPDTPRPFTPEDRANITSVNGIKWLMGSLSTDEPTGNMVYRPDPGIASFRLQVSTTPTFTGTFVDATIQADYGAGGIVPRQPPVPSYIFTPALGDGTYYWRVSATDIAGHVGQFSTPRRFTVDTLAPTIFPPFVCDFVQETRLCQSPLTIVAGGTYDNKLMVVSGGTDDTCCPTIIGSGIHRVTAQIIGPASSNSVLAETELTFSKVTDDWRGNFTFTGTLPEGLYTVKVVVTDWAGNHSEAVIDGPVLYDQTPPVLTIPQTITAEASNPVGTQLSFTATAVDNVDGPVTPSCAPTSGSTFLLDVSTTVTCRAYDRATNFMDASFVVMVVDTTPPSLTVPSAITVEATGPLTTVTYAVSASDLVDGNVPVQCSSPSGSLFPLGGTIVTCTAKDRHSTVGISGFSVTVRDTTPPKTMIASVMDGNGYTIPSGGRTPSASVTFVVQSSDLVGIAYTECSLDSQPFARCPAPGYTGLTASTHGFQVRSVDMSGNRDPTPASFTWTVRSPSQAVQDLMDQLNTLRNSGQLHSAQEGGLLSLLTKAQTDLSTGSMANAITDLKLFISHVQILEKNGKLANADGKALIDYACDIVKSFGGTC